MTNEQAIYRRVLRRETHAPRTIPAATVASIGLLLALALLAAGVWAFIDAAFREGVVRRFEDVTASGAPQGAAFGIGAALALLAVLLLALAVLPGRRARRARTTDRAALLVDDGVIADSIADSVARRTGVDRARVAVTVGRRSVAVRITPTSGLPVDAAAAESAVNDTMSGIGFASTPRIIIEADGVIA